MCMIAYRPMGKGNIPQEVVNTAMRRHPDGYGLMWRDATGLHTQAFAPKGAKAFRKALKVADKSGVEYASHFRFATSGPRNVDMAHPYTYEDPDPSVGTVAVMHNGVIDIKHDRAVESDTSAFVRLVLAELPTRWWANGALVYLVGEAIGWSKFVLMTGSETVNLHEERGKWAEGIWYSSDHLPTPAYVAGPGPAKGYGYFDKFGRWVSTAWSGKGERTDTPALALLPPLSKSARESAARLGLVTAATTDEAVRMVDQPQGFRHAGHNLTAIADIRLDDGDADYEDSVICDTCGTTGTVYVIDEAYYIDMAHLSGTDDDEDTFLPATVAGSVRG